MMSMVLFVVLMLSACAEHEDVVVPVDPQSPEAPVAEEDDTRIGLAFACVPSSGQAFTRQADNVVQLNGSYRAINDFSFVALRKDNGNNIINFPFSDVDDLDGTQDKTTFRYYHFGYCNMEQGVNACLVYGKAQDADKDESNTPLTTSLATKAYNGSLSAYIPSYPELMSTGQILFFPESIIDDASDVDENGIPNEAWTLANALTALVIPAWKASDNIILKNLLKKFINNGADLPGSAASVRQWMLALKDAADTYNNPMSFAAIGDDETVILTAISTAAGEAAAAVTGTYPQNFYLPDGAAVVRWTGEKFEPQMQTTTLDDINTVSRFAFPPSLYYFAESGIFTSNDENLKFDTYKGDTDWTTVLARFTDGTKIGLNTKVVAIQDPLQYAVAHLSLKVYAESASLKYAKDESDADKTIALQNNGTNIFRLTGIIVGSQHPVGYNFTPVSNSDADVKFLYDSHVKADSWLTTTSTEMANTLVLQSNDDEDVIIILEMEYTGDEEFRCLNGFVYPNTRFYLVGKVKVADINSEDPNYTDDNKGRIFTKDHTTWVEMKITSLEKAYNVLPSILSKNLEISVMTVPKWTAATPTDPIVMD